MNAGTLSRSCALGTLLLALALPATASAAPRFQGRASGYNGNAYVPTHSFPVGATFGLSFRDNQQANTTYKLCAIFRGRFRGCDSGRTGAAGKWVSKGSDQVFDVSRVGKITWRWSVDGKTVARWTVTMTIGD
jgi:hypothetical protein